jgi:hypothetical protein
MEIIKDFIMPAEYWAVGSYWQKNEQTQKNDQTEDFLKKDRWIDGFGKLNNPKNINKLNEVRIDDYFIMKSSSNRGQDRQIPFTRVKAIGKITGRIDWFTFSVKWRKVKHIDFDNISYRSTIVRLRNDELLKFAKKFIKDNDLWYL